MKNLLKKLFQSKQIETFDWESDSNARKARMEIKRQQAIKELGTNWILHPDNKKQRLEKQRPV